MGLRIYLAAPWANRDEAREAATKFVDAGHTITEAWWDQEQTNDHEELLVQAYRDVEGVLTAHIVVVYQLGPSEGKAVETGIAMASGIPVIVVSPKDGGRGIGKAGNLFQLLLPILDSIEDAVALADKLLAEAAEAVAAQQAQEVTAQGDGDSGTGRVVG